LFNLAQDPGETNNLAEQNPQKVEELKKRVEALAKEAVPPLFVQEAFGATKKVLFGSVALPDDDKALDLTP